MSDGEHEKAMHGGDTTGDNNDDFFACISQLNTAFVIQHGIVDSLDHCCCISTLSIAVPMEQRHDLVSKVKWARKSRFTKTKTGAPKQFIFKRSLTHSKLANRKGGILKKVKEKEKVAAKQKNGAFAFTFSFFKKGETKGESKGESVCKTSLLFKYT